MINQIPIKCVIMRGGTSKGVFFNVSNLPADPEVRDRVILSIMGSPDPRQINGLGGADYLTSKICIIGPGSAHGADVSYTFGQVGFEQAYVTYFSNCGNLSAAVGVYAIEEGFVKAVEPITEVRIFNTNTEKMLIARVPVKNGGPEVEGDYSISGVPGTGAEIRMDFSRTAGATTGKILPTGNPQDDLYVPELGRSIRVSIVDVSKATIFFHPADVGIKGTEGPADFTEEVLQRYWAIRNAGAKLIGLRPETRLPTPVSVLPPTDYVDFMTKNVIKANQISLVARRVNGPPPRLHKAMAGTGAVPLAMAALIKGTVVNEVSRDIGDGIVRIGHPTGIFPVRIETDGNGNVVEASFSRTARRLMEGFTYLPHSKWTN